MSEADAGLFKSGLIRLEDARFAFERAVMLGGDARPEAEALAGEIAALSVQLKDRQRTNCGPIFRDIEKNLSMLRDGIIQPNAQFVAVIAHSIGLVRSSLLNETPDPTRNQVYAGGQPADGRAPLKDGAADGRAPRFLIADSDTINRRLLASLLEPVGECHQAENGQQALNRIRMALSHLKPYDMIFLDVIMPGYDGREVMNELRRLEQAAGEGRIRRARVIFTPSLSDTGFLRSMDLQKLCDGVLYKPIRTQQLMEMLKQLGLIAQAG